MPKLNLIFEWDGKTVHKETTGFTGKSCTEQTKFIEEALNGQNQKRRYKAEYLDDSRLSEDRLRA